MPKAELRQFQAAICIFKGARLNSSLCHCDADSRRDNASVVNDLELDIWYRPLPVRTRHTVREILRNTNDRVTSPKYTYTRLDENTPTVSIPATPALTASVHPQEGKRLFVVRIISVLMNLHTSFPVPRPHKKQHGPYPVCGLSMEDETFSHLLS